ncbi:unnamed protein product, partial [Effrenium voratum]
AEEGEPAPDAVPVTPPPATQQTMLPPPVSRADLQESEEAGAGSPLPTPAFAPAVAPAPAPAPAAPAAPEAQVSLADSLAAAFAGVGAAEPQAEADHMPSSAPEDQAAMLGIGELERLASRLGCSQSAILQAAGIDVSVVAALPEDMRASVVMAEVSQVNLDHLRSATATHDAPEVRVGRGSKL